MKRIIFSVLAICLILIIVPVEVFAATVTASGTTGSCKWVLRGDALTIYDDSNNPYRDDPCIHIMDDCYSFKYQRPLQPPWGRDITSVFLTNTGNVGMYAFYNCEKLKAATMQACVKNIYSHAFDGCTNLTRVTFSNNLKTIGAYAFSHCTSLSSIALPDSLTRIESNAFYDTGIYNNESNWEDNALYISDCLVAVKKNDLNNQFCVKDGTRLIADEVFSGCTGLTSITIPDSVTSRGYQIFDGCNIKELIIADGSKTVTSTMVVCESTLEKVTIPDSVTSIEDNAFSGCRGLTSITIPDSVTSIGSYAFSECSGLTSITIPDSVTSIGGAAFSECSDLTSITIPDSVTSIGGYAFYRCSRLTSITIPDSVTSIGKYAFYDCTGLTSIIIPSSVTSIDSSAFSGCDKSKLIIYTDSMAATAYKYAKDNGYRCVVLLNSNDEIGFSIDGSTLTVIGTGKMPDYNLFTSTPWYSAKDSIKRVIVDSRITEVGTYSFYGFDNLKELVCENANLKLGTRAINTDNKNIHVYSLSGGSLEKYCSDNSVNFVSPLDAPILVSVTGNSITVKAADGVNAEFSLDGVNWQRSGQFNSLQPVTEYKVYSRRYNEYSPIASEPLVVKTTKSTVSAPGAPTIEEYSVNKVTLKAISGYEYSCDGGLTWQSSNVFEGIAQNKIYEFCVRKAETETVFASEKSAALYFALPKVPEIERIGATTLTLKAVDGFEYSLDKIEWQTSPHFTGLINNMTYTVYQRISGSQYSNSYKLISSGTDVCINGTDKTTPAKPSAPIVSSKTSSSVTLKATAGYEYSLDGKVWHSSNVFDGLKDDTEYTFYQRIAETETSYVSECSTGLKVKTDKAYTGGELDGDGKITDKDAIYLLMHCYFPGDYPVEQPCDYNGDGIINDKDAVYLLMHCYFPNDYPITK